MSQLTFGLMNGETKVEPVKAGDVLVRHDGRRFVVTDVSDNLDGEVYVGIYQATGTEAVLLAREVAYRSR